MLMEELFVVRVIVKAGPRTKKNVNKLIASQYLDSQFLYTHFSLSFRPTMSQIFQSL